MHTINIENLDLYELRELTRLTKQGMNLDEALQVIINSVEGDETQLSEELRGYIKGVK